MAVAVESSLNRAYAVQRQFHLDVAVTVSPTTRRVFATLTVQPNANRLVNLSVLTAAGAGDRTLIVGFVVSGTGESLLVRGAGPALQSLGVTGAPGDPRIAISSGSAVVASNDDWSTAGNAAQVASTATQLGAFAFPSGSLDAALLVALDPGSDTARVSGIAGTTGVALVELHDLRQ